jgi:hypothetical protein
VIAAAAIMKVKQRLETVTPEMAAKAIGAGWHGGIEGLESAEMSLGSDLFLDMLGASPLTNEGKMKHDKDEGSCYDPDEFRSDDYYDR